MLGDSTGEPTQQLGYPRVFGAGLEGYETALSGGWWERLESY